MEHRRNSIDKSTLESGEKAFVADIKMPGDLPLPEHDLLSHGRHHVHRKSVDGTTAGDAISHDKIVRTPDQIVSLGPVEGQEKFDNMQGFQKELALEGQGAKGSRPLSDVGIRSLGPVRDVDEHAHGFQKDLTLGGANTERPAHLAHPAHLKSEASLEADHALDTIPEVAEKKGIVTRAVESVAAAAGTVVGIFSNSEKNEKNNVEKNNVEKNEKSSFEKNEFFVEGEEEKGLVDTAVEKVWNIITGKEELFPSQQGQVAPPAEEQHQQLNADAPVFVPHGFIPQGPNATFQQQQQQQQQPQFIPAEILLQQQQQQPQFTMTPEQYLQQQQQLQQQQLQQQQQQLQQGFVLPSPQGAFQPQQFVPVQGGFPQQQQPLPGQFYPAQHSQQLSGQLPQLPQQLQPQQPQFQQQFGVPPPANNQGTYQFVQTTISAPAGQIPPNNFQQQ